jgi:hypothetical protein
MCVSLQNYTFFPERKNPDAEGARFSSVIGSQLLPSHIIISFNRNDVHRFSPTIHLPLIEDIIKRQMWTIVRLWAGQNEICASRFFSSARKPIFSPTTLECRIKQ